MLQGKAGAYAQHFTLCAKLAVRQREGKKDRVTGRVRWRDRKLVWDKLRGCSYMMQDSSVTLNKSASPDFQTVPDCVISVSMCSKPTLNIIIHRYNLYLSMWIVRNISLLSACHLTAPYSTFALKYSSFNSCLYFASAYPKNPVITFSTSFPPFFFDCLMIKHCVW